MRESKQNGGDIAIDRLDEELSVLSREWNAHIVLQFMQKARVSQDEKFCAALRNLNDISEEKEEKKKTRPQKHDRSSSCGRLTVVWTGSETQGDRISKEHAVAQEQRLHCARTSTTGTVGGTPQLRKLPRVGDCLKQTPGQRTRAK
jgi:hypothetical protein